MHEACKVIHSSSPDGTAVACDDCIEHFVWLENEIEVGEICGCIQENAEDIMCVAGDTPVVQPLEWFETVRDAGGKVDIF